MVETVRRAEKIELRRVDDLIPYARNARKHSDAQIDKIAASIRQFGFNNPVLVDASGTIIAGHGRVLGAKRAGLDAVPVVPIEYLSDAERRAYVLADNRIAEDASWDDALLAEELAAIDLAGLDLALTGFDTKELDKLLDEGAGGAAAAPADRKRKVGSLNDRFGVAPFSVLNAREGWWQERKRAWLALGIQSELGRGDNLASLDGAIERREAIKANATPGGSKMPAADYSVSRARGDGRGRAVANG